MADAFPSESLESHSGLMKSCLDQQEIAKEVSDRVQMIFVSHRGAGSTVAFCDHADRASWLF
jgi:hypothetical protein